RAVAGDLRVFLNHSSNPAAPGMIKSHYAPRVPLLLGEIEELLESQAGQRVGILSFSRRWPASACALQVQLAPSGSLREAAAVLFAALRHLDSEELDVILAEPAPDEGLGRAINDRSRRAAARD